MNQDAYSVILSNCAGEERVATKSVYGPSKRPSIVKAYLQSPGDEET